MTKIDMSITEYYSPTFLVAIVYLYIFHVYLMYAGRV